MSSELSRYLRCKRDDGSECTVDLTALEEALDGPEVFEYYFFPENGRTVSVFTDEIEDLDSERPEGLPIDRIESRTRFKWMEQFADSVHSVTVKFQLAEALRRPKPFRNFKDVLAEFPKVRDLWFAFESQKTKAAAIAIIEDLGWEILQVVDDQPDVDFSEPQDPSVHAPISDEEHTWILRGTWEVALKGGRTQLALLLKGSKNKDVLKHQLDKSPSYGRLSFLTIPEIENRIDQEIRRGKVAIVRSGDLPLVVLTPEGWASVLPWAHVEEARRAALTNESTLNRIVSQWRQRPRKEQGQLVEVLKSLPHDQSSRIAEAWHAVSGKEIRSRLERIFQQD